MRRGSARSRALHRTRSIDCVRREWLLRGAAPRRRARPPTGNSHAGEMQRGAVAPRLLTLRTSSASFAAPIPPGTLDEWVVPLTERSPHGNDALPRRPRAGAAGAHRRPGRRWFALAGAALLGCASLRLGQRPPPAPLASPGSVRGQLAEDAALAAPSEPLLVFLEPLEASGAPTPEPKEPVLRASEHGLEPSVLAVSAGRSIRFANESGIYHRIFSYSDSNGFDLGVVRGGERRTLPLRHPGVVRVYCSLHPSERAVVFVAPSPWFTTFRPPDPYEVRDVPPGRYRIHAWSESASAVTRAVTVPPGATVAVEIAARPAAAE